MPDADSLGEQLYAEQQLEISDKYRYAQHPLTNSVLRQMDRNLLMTVCVRHAFRTPEPDAHCMRCGIIPAQIFATLQEPFEAKWVAYSNQEGRQGPWRLVTDHPFICTLYKNADGFVDRTTWAYNSAVMKWFL